MLLIKSILHTIDNTNDQNLISHDENDNLTPQQSTYTITCTNYKTGTNDKRGKQTITSHRKQSFTTHYKIVNIFNISTHQHTSSNIISNS